MKMYTSYESIEQIKKIYHVKSHKETGEGLIAIRKNGYWLYFRYSQVNGNWAYYQTGSTLFFEK